MNKLISGVFIIAGTTIGGGMVMLPAVIGIHGFFSAISLLTFVCCLNIIIALIFLEANCYLPVNTSLISMTKKLLGPRTELFAWVICLGFLYTIMCVYISGITEIISNFLDLPNIPPIYFSIVAVITVSLPIFFGIRFVGHFSRCMVVCMFLAFFIILFSLIPHLDADNLFHGAQHFPLLALPIVFTSFGFLIVIPTLRSFFNDDIKKIKTVIIIGSVIPLITYILWTTVVMGTIPILGKDGLQDIVINAEPVKHMTTSLVSHSGSISISFFIQIFVLFAIASSFVGVSLGLYDFLADGLKISKTSVGKIKLLAITFLPPLIISLTQNRLFLTALGFAGLISTILFGLFPTIMTWSGRYVQKLETHYRVSVNELFFILIIVFCIIIIGVESLEIYNKLY